MTLHHEPNKLDLTSDHNKIFTVWKVYQKKTKTLDLFCLVIFSSVTPIIRAFVDVVAVYHEESFYEFFIEWNSIQEEIFSWKTCWGNVKSGRNMDHDSTQK